MVGDDEVVDEKSTKDSEELSGGIDEEKKEEKVHAEELKDESMEATSESS